MSHTTYDPKKVNVIVDGTVITGFASDSMVTADKSEDSISTEAGCQGDIAISENANESGTIGLSLQGTSPSIAFLRSLASARKEVQVVISDANESDSVKINASQCRVVKTPGVSRGKTAGSVAVNIFVPNLQIR